MVRRGEGVVMRSGVAEVAAVQHVFARASAGPMPTPPTACSSLVLPHLAHAVRTRTRTSTQARAHKHEHKQGGNVGSSMLIKMVPCVARALIVGLAGCGFLVQRLDHVAFAVACTKKRRASSHLSVEPNRRHQS